jgi:hypothetical protein
MATSTSAPTAIVLMPVSEKLVRTNHTVRKAQVLAVLRGAQLAGFLDGSTKVPKEKLIVKSSKEGDDDEIPNLAFTTWKAQEQQVLSYLLTSVSHDVLIQITALPSACEA